MPRPDVLLGEGSRTAMLRGLATCGRLLALTLGPAGGAIANEPEGTGQVEILRDAATAARRLIQLPNPHENPGAMLARHIAWRMRQEVGDGSATAIVIAQALAEEMQRVIAAGAHVMAVKRGVERGLRAAVAALAEMAIPLEGEERIAAVATAATGDAEIGRLLGEIYDILGPDASVVIAPYVATRHDRAYYQGTRIAGGCVSPYLLRDEARQTAVLQEPHIVAADMAFESAESAINLLEQAAQAGGGDLLLLCKRCSDRAVGVLAANNRRGKGFCSVATIKALGEARRGWMENVAILTGARPFLEGMGLRPESITARDMGRARRVVVERERVTIVDGHGERGAVAERRTKLQERARRASDADERAQYRALLGQLAAGVAELRLGALTERARAELTETAQEGIRAVQAGMEGGIVPGGGAAYLACIPAVRALEAQGEARLGIEIVARTLEAPMRRIAANAHIHPPTAIAEAQQRGPGYGLDARTGRIVDLFAEGIADPAVVARRALDHGVSGAMMLLTTDALVIHRIPKGSEEP